VDPRDTSSECPQCDSKLAENEYRRLKCPRCGYEADRDVVGKLNIRKRALKMLGIKAIHGEFWLLNNPQMIDVNRCKRIDEGTNKQLKDILRLEAL